MSLVRTLDRPFSLIHYFYYKSGVRLQFSISNEAASELVRQSAFLGTPGVMKIDLVEDSCGEGWIHIRIQKLEKDTAVPIARSEGITLFSDEKSINILKGLKLNYFGDLSGGGFLISAPEGAESCACGSGFRFKIKTKKD